MNDKSVNNAIQEQRVRRACTEVERRIACGQREVVEDVLRDEPNIAENCEHKLELVYAEIAASHEMGIFLTAQELQQRFPDLSSRIDRLLEVHHAFGEGDVDLDSPAANQQSRSDTLFSSHTDTIRSPKASPRVLNADDRFEMGDLIGRGATGSVYRATQRGLDRPIAIKILRRNELDDEALVRFHREAAACASLQHPNIVQVYEVGELEQLPFIAMELMTGGTLAERMTKTITSEKEDAALIARLASAIEHAHQRGIVHRDLKPANILLTDDLEPKVADFGLALVLSDGDQHVTKTGAVLGTPAYMAPEQACGGNDSTSPATDVYSLGAILYELITGRCPFRGATLLETLDQVRYQDPIAPRHLCLQLSRDLETICLNCLSKQPQHRYPSAASLRDDLQRFINGEPISARRISTTRRVVKWIRRRPLESALVAIALTAVAVAGTGISWQWSRANREARIAIDHSQVAQQQQLIAERVRDRAITSERQAQRNYDEVQKLVLSLIDVSGQLSDQPRTDSIRLAALVEAYESFSEFREVRADDPDYLSLMNALNRRLGGVYHERYELGPGRKHFDEATRAADQLTNRFPLNADYRSLRARTYLLSGIFLNQACNDPENACKALRISVEECQSILSTDPSDSHVADRLGIALINLASALGATESIEKQEENTEQAIEVQTASLLELPAVADDKMLSEFIVATSSKNLDYHPDELAVKDVSHRTISSGLAQRLLRFSLSMELRGLTQDRRGRTHQAIWNFRCCAAIQQFIVNYAVAESHHSHHLARSKFQLAKAVLKTGDRAEAHDHLEWSLATWNHLTEDYPERPEFIDSLFGVRELLANLAVEDKDMASIEAFLDAVPGLHETALNSASDEFRQELSLNRTLNNYCSLLRSAGYLTEAERAGRYCLQFRKELAEREQSNVPFAIALAGSYTALSSVLDLQERNPESVQHISNAIEIWQNLVHENPNDVRVALAHSKALRHKAFRTWKDQDFQAAISAGLETLARTEDDSQLQNSMAWLLTMHPDQSKRQSDYALVLAQRACEARPTSFSRMHTLATCLCRAQRYQEARQAIDASISLAGKDDVFNTVILAMIHIGNHDKEKASKVLAKCSADDTSTPDYRRQVTRLILEAEEMLARLP